MGALGPFRHFLLAKELERLKNATGAMPEDFKYAQADAVRRYTIGYVFVTFGGKEYGPLRESFGAIDLDPKKSTVLVQVDGGIWYKLWYFDYDVEDARSTDF